MNHRKKKLFSGMLVAFIHHTWGAIPNNHGMHSWKMCNIAAGSCCMIVDTPVLWKTLLSADEIVVMYDSVLVTLDASVTKLHSKIVSV